MKKNLILIGICLGLLLIFTSFNLSIFPSTPIKSITIGSVVLDKLEIVDTDAEREQGLSGRESIESNFGMLFVFDKPGVYGFWMKEMNFSIDMIWLDENFKVTGLKSNATPESYPQTYYSEDPSLYVLETSPGVISSQNLKIGESLKVNN